eukprot:GFYU01004108.1.p1 GENE.GFYU01004108.1~~GFYU01004108.1.p1  ORF type:complete len:465 (+),score=89.23 GFYU01004108.1:71-1396(+)
MCGRARCALDPSLVREVAGVAPRDDEDNGSDGPAKAKMQKVDHKETKTEVKDEVKDENMKVEKTVKTEVKEEDVKKESSDVNPVDSNIQLRAVKLETGVVLKVEMAPTKAKEHAHVKPEPMDMDGNEPLKTPLKQEVKEEPMEFDPTDVLLKEPEVVRKPPSWKHEHLYFPNENVCPGSYTPVIVAGKEGGRQLHSMKWGLIPFYQKSDQNLDYFRMMNARSETADTSGAYRRLVQKKRCVVICQGFYEWDQPPKGQKKKQPYYITRRERPCLYFAGLYDCWKNGDGQLIFTYTIMTTDICPQLEWLHNRMPVILEENQIDDWINPEVPYEKLKKILKPYTAQDLHWYPVSNQMNDMKYKGADCSVEVSLKPKNTILSYFTKSPAKKQAPNTVFNIESGAEEVKPNASPLPVGRTGSNPLVLTSSGEEPARQLRKRKAGMR